MEETTIVAFLRDKTGKSAVRKLRKKGLVPAVLYGHGVQSTALSIEETLINKMIRNKTSEHMLHPLEIKGENGIVKKTVMIKDVQYHPVTHKILHVDLYEVKMDEEIVVSVPLHLRGKAVGATKGGILQQIYREVEIKCLPTKIPEYLELDVTTLDIGDSFHIKDIPLPEGIKMMEDSEDTVVTILAPVVEEVEEKEVEEAISPPEEEKKPPVKEEKEE